MGTTFLLTYGLREGEDEVCYSLIQTTDGGYAMGGSKGSDFWLVKVDKNDN